MEVSYYLKRTKSKKPTAIFARICYGGQQLKYYIPESITPSFWNKATQRVRESAKFPEYPEFNARLDNISTAIKTAIRKYANDHDLQLPDRNTLRELLDACIRKKVNTETQQSFMTFFEELIKNSGAGVRLNPKTGKPISTNTIKTYTTTFKHLKAFQEKNRLTIDFKTIDLQFYTRYTEFLIKEYKLSTNAIGKDMQILKLVLNEATEHGLNTNLAYKGRRFVTVREKADTIYLTQEELNEMVGLDLSGRPRLDRVRDSFLIGCFTGLRFSDFSTFDPSKIKNGFIEVTQTKTCDPVVIPIHSRVEVIIKKYNGLLPRSITNQKMNEYIKEIASLLPCLQKPVEIRFTKAGESQVKTLPKCELVTTHTARRSFATNEFIAGTPTLTIMSITGHRTEKAFLKYVRVTPNEHAKLLRQTWEKRKIG